MAASDGNHTRHHDAQYVQDLSDDDQRCAATLADQLVDLQDGSERLSRLVRVACQRSQWQHEEWPEHIDGPNDPMPLPPIEVLQSELTGEPVLVVAGEALIPTYDDEHRSRMRTRVKEIGLRIEEDCVGALRVGVPQGEPGDTRALLRRLDEQQVAGAPHYVAALRGDMKSLDGPEYTDNPPDAQLFDTAVGQGAIVVIVDTGIDPYVAQRGDQWLYGMEQSDRDPLDVFDEVTGAVGGDGFLDGGAGHGTFVAGIVRLVAPGADVRVFRALDTRGLGTECAIARAIDRAGRLFRERGRPGVLNLSLGIQTADGLPPFVVEEALRRLPDDVLVVAAGGNVPLDEPIWPAWSKRAIGVGALAWDTTGTLVPAAWSNSGHHVDFSAVGDGVSSTYVRGREHLFDDRDREVFPRLGRRGANPEQTDSYALWSGSSFSAPKVSGLLARLVVDHAGEPSPAAAAVRALRAGRDHLPGYGYIIEF